MNIVILILMVVVLFTIALNPKTDINNIYALIHLGAVFTIISILCYPISIILGIVITLFSILILGIMSLFVYLEDKNIEV